jgi:hypothetical protein
LTKIHNFNNIRVFFLFDFVSQFVFSLESTTTIVISFRFDPWNFQFLFRLRPCSDSWRRKLFLWVLTRWNKDSIKLLCHVN